MSNFVKNTPKQILLLSVVLLVINFILSLINSNIAPSLNYVSILLLFILTNAVILLITKTKTSSSPQSLMNIFMASSIAKMFLLLVYIFIIVFMKLQNTKILLIYILIYFVLYLIFEVAVLIKRIKQV